MTCSRSCGAKHRPKVETCLAGHPVSERDRYGHCRPCGAERAAQRRQTETGMAYAAMRSSVYAIKRREGHLLKKYGLTLSQFDAMVEAQHGKCYVCQRVPDELVVDHCHESGRVRKLLCHRCNRVLGWAADSPALLRVLAGYLDEHH